MSRILLSHAANAASRLTTLVRMGNPALIGKAYRPSAERALAPLSELVRCISVQVRLRSDVFWDTRRRPRRRIPCLYACPRASWTSVNLFLGVENTVH